MLLDKGDLSLIRTVEPDKAGFSPGPMLVVEDKVRRVFYVGNFNRGFLAVAAQIEMAGKLMFESDYGGTHWLASFAIYYYSGSGM